MCYKKGKHSSPHIEYCYGFHRALSSEQFSNPLGYVAIFCLTNCMLMRLKQAAIMELLQPSKTLTRASHAKSFMMSNNYK